MSVIAKNLSKSYNEGKIQALNNISLYIDKGEIFGLIGPDGAGKTTLFRILATLLLPDNGQATINGLDVIKDYKKLRNILGYMAGRFSLYQDLSVKENIDFFATIFNTSLKENYSLIKDIYIQLEPFKNRKAGALSGGMKQKLALCCALIHQPELLILDEPTFGVDALSRKEFWEILHKFKQTGMMILVSTPYMDEAKLCDRIALIQQGELMVTDTPANIVKKNKNPLFAIRTESNYTLLKDLKIYDNTLAVYPFGQYLHYNDKNEEPVSGLEKYLSAQGHKNIIIKQIEPDIEDCFINLMTNNNE